MRSAAEPAVEKRAAMRKRVQREDAMAGLSTELRRVSVSEPCRKPVACYLASAMTLEPALEAEMRALVDEYRERCLWFVRPDYYPSTPGEVLRVLRWIRARGDREAFQRAG